MTRDNILDYQVYDRQDGEIKVNIVAAKNALLDSWAEFYKDSDVRLNAIDVDVFAFSERLYDVCRGRREKRNGGYF